MNFMPVDSEISSGMQGRCCGEKGGETGGDRRLTYSDSWIKGWGRKARKQGFVIQEVELRFSKIRHWSGCTVWQTQIYSY